MGESMSRLSAKMWQAIQVIELERVQVQYWAQNECAVLEHFLPDDVLAHYLLPEAEILRADLHRTYIPRHKKGGSVSYYTLVEKVPAVLTLYRNQGLRVATRVREEARHGKAA